MRRGVLGLSVLLISGVAFALEGDPGSAQPGGVPSIAAPAPEPTEVRHQTWSQILVGKTVRLFWPLAAHAHTRVTSPYGERVHPIEGILKKHSGVDLAAALGQPVQAAAPGKVVSAGWKGGYGNQVELEHAGGIRTRYSHLSSILVEPGAMVEAGSAVGLAGATGTATGVHLHFEVLRQGRARNPMSWFRHKKRRRVYVARLTTAKASS